jgi:hypothetical protein
MLTDHSASGSGAGRQESGVLLGNPWSEVAIVSGAGPWRTVGRPPYEALEQASVAATLLLFKFLDSMALIGVYLARQRNAAVEC